jgi:hypothetical protein
MIAVQASSEERAAVDAIIARAKTGKRDSAVYKITPGMAAILFINHNPHKSGLASRGGKIQR